MQGGVVVLPVAGLPGRTLTLEWEGAPGFNQQVISGLKMHTDQPSRVPGQSPSPCGPPALALGVWVRTKLTPCPGTFAPAAPPDLSCLFILPLPLPKPLGYFS